MLRPVAITFLAPMYFAIWTARRPAVPVAPFTSFEFRALLHGGPRRHARITDRGGRHVVQPIRQRDALTGPHHSPFRHAAERRLRKNEVHAAAVIKATHAIDPHHERQIPRGAVVRSGSAASYNVAERGRGDVDANFAIAGNWIFEISVDGRLVSLQHDCCFHLPLPFLLPTRDISV